MGMIIANTLAILPDGTGHAAGRHDIYIEGSDIVGIDGAPEGFSADETIDGTRRLTIPGLINAHTHTYMSMMRNVADDLSFTDWLFGTVEPIEDRLEPEDAYWASLLGQIEMIKSGTTCFNDQQMHIGQTTRAVVESGMRAVICRGLVGGGFSRLYRPVDHVAVQDHHGGGIQVLPGVRGWHIGVRGGGADFAGGLQRAAVHQE